MSNMTDRVLTEIENRIFTHDGKFPKGFDFIVLTGNENGVISAVYILLSDDGLLYVGQSKNVIQRIKKHRKNRIIPFTKCAYLAIRPDLRDEMESSLIWNFKPKYNKAYPRLSDTALAVLRRGN